MSYIKEYYKEHKKEILKQQREYYKNTKGKIRKITYVRFIEDNKEEIKKIMFKK